MVVGALTMVYSKYLKYRIVLLHTKYGYKAPTIAKLLLKEGDYLSRRGISKFINRYKERGTVCRKPGSSHPSKVTEAFVEAQMRKDDETTAYRLLRDDGIPQLHVLNVLEYVYVLYIYFPLVHACIVCVCVYVPRIMLICAFLKLRCALLKWSIYLRNMEILAQFAILRKRACAISILRNRKRWVDN